MSVFKYKVIFERNSLHKNYLRECHVPQLESLQKCCGNLLKNLNIHVCHK